MISIKSTPKLNGITIQGDFDDLNNLYEAISDYTTFYIDGILNEIEAEYVKEHGVAIKDMTAEQRDTFFQLNQSEITYFEELRENILGLCYDIRHAYQGDRNIETVENNHENIAQLASCIYQLDEKSIEKERKKYKTGDLTLIIPKLSLKMWHIEETEICIFSERIFKSNG